MLESLFRNIFNGSFINYLALIYLLSVKRDKQQQNNVSYDKLSLTGFNYFISLKMQHFQKVQLYSFFPDFIGLPLVFFFFFKCKTVTKVTNYEMVYH